MEYLKTHAPRLHYFLDEHVGNALYKLWYAYTTCWQALFVYPFAVRAWIKTPYHQLPYRYKRAIFFLHGRYKVWDSIDRCYHDRVRN